jgi:phage-related protein
MASRIAEAYVQIVPRIDGVASGLNQQLSGSLAGAGAAGATGLVGGMKKVIGPALAAGAALGLGNFVKSTIEAAEGARVASSRIDSITKTIGLFGDESSEVSGRIQEFAESQERLLAVDADVIKGFQGQLLTFKGLAQTADVAGGAFDRATVAALDLNAANLGGGNAAVALGKALENPIKGITALSRSGVTFTDQEQEKIKTLTESGRLLEAQDMILEAIEGQVGGTAEATATSSEKMSLGFEAVKDSIGNVLLPAFDSLAGGIADKVLYPLAEAIPRIQDFFVKVGAFAKPFVDGFTTAFSEAGGGIEGFISGLMDLRARLVDTFVKALPGIVQAIVAFIPQAVTASIGMITSIISAIVAALPMIIEGAVQLFSGIIQALVIAIPLIITALVNAIPIIVAALVAALPIIIDGAIKLFTGLVNGLVAVIPILINGLVQMIPKIVTALTNSLPLIITGAITLFLGLIQGLLRALPQIISALVKAIPLLINALVKALPQIIAGAIQLFLGVVTGLIRALPQIIDAIIKAIPQIVRALIDAVPKFIDAGFQLIRGLIKGLIDNAPKVIEAIKKSITSRLPQFIKDALGIKSPSIVFAGIGKNIVEGLAMGISKNARLPMKALSKVNKDLAAFEAGSLIDSAPSVLTPSNVLKGIQGAMDGSKSERPIYADGIGLVGWIREVANGEATLVFNAELSKVTRGNR